MPVPDKIKNKPEIKPGLDLYWRAFQDLSTDRDVGMGVGPIPWLAIHAWAERNYIRGDDFERLVLILRGLDNIYLEKQAAKDKSKSKLGKKQGFNKSKALRSK
jgi:hypothetical protein